MTIKKTNRAAPVTAPKGYKSNSEIMSSGLVASSGKKKVLGFDPSKGSGKLGGGYFDKFKENPIISGLSGILGTIKDLTSGPIAFITSPVDSAGSIISGVKGYMNKTSSFLKDAMGTLAKWKNNTLKYAYDIKKGIVDTIGNGLSSLKDLHKSIDEILSFGDKAKSELEKTAKQFEDLVSYDGIFSNIKNNYNELSGTDYKKNNTRDVSAAYIDSHNLQIADSVKRLENIFNNYKSDYDQLLGNGGVPITTKYSDVTLNHLNSLIQIIKVQCPGLNLPDEVADFAKEKTLFDIIAQDLALRGISEILRLLLECKLYSDNRTNLILKDVLFDVASAGDVFTVEVIVTELIRSGHGGLIPNKDALLKTLLYNIGDIGDLNSTSRASLLRVVSKLNIDMDRIFFTPMEANINNQTVMGKSVDVYDLQEIASLSLVNMSVPNLILEEDDTNMFNTVAVLYRDALSA